MAKHRNRFVLWFKVLFRSAFLLFAVPALLFLFIRSFASFPDSREARKDAALARVRALSHALHEEDAAARMQKIFPEGGCFTLTLSGLAWANVVRNHEIDAETNAAALREIAWVLDQYEKPHVIEPFFDTQVRNGVFWLGQRNLVLGRYLELLPEKDRPPELVAEFHNNSRELAEAFLASPTYHLDTYTGMCWPADNVTALASLVVHDRLYGTEYREAYEAWKRWTLEHPDSGTGMPAGHLDRKRARLLQPARGCANSWILGLLPEMDPEFAREQYALYREHFLITRLGFRMVREYPGDSDFPADVDSGPIVWGAGVTATGVGLAAAVANGDLATANDIHDLACMFGFPDNIDVDGETGTRYLFGALPTGDAFLAWGYSLAPPGVLLSSAPSPGREILDRWTFHLLILVLLFLMALLGYSVYRLLAKR